VEYRHIIDEFQRVALAHPNIYFTFFIMEVKCSICPSSMRQRIVTIFSGKTNEKLVPVQEETDRYDSWIYVSLNLLKKTEENSFLCQ
jgi:DNA mismatch repair protein MutL